MKKSKKKNEESCHLCRNNLCLKDAQPKCFSSAQVKKRGVVFWFDEWDSKRMKKGERAVGFL